MSSVLGIAEKYSGVIRRLDVPRRVTTGIAAEEAFRRAPEPTVTIIEVPLPWTIFDQDFKEHEMASKKLGEQPVPLWLGGLALAAIFGAFGWGFSILNESISGFHKEAHTDIQNVQKEIKSLTEVVHSDAMSTSKQIDEVAKQLAVTNSHLENLSTKRR